MDMVDFFFTSTYQRAQRWHSFSVYCSSTGLPDNLEILQHNTTNNCIL